METKSTKMKPTTRSETKVVSNLYERDMEYLNDNLVHFLFKNKKSENDSYNQVRERVIDIFISYFEKGIPKENQCFELFERFKLCLFQYGIVKVLGHQKKAGRNTFDFVLTCQMKDSDEEKEMILEFKNNSDKVEKLPEFLQIYTNNKETRLTKKDYHRYYYDQFLPKVLEFVEKKYDKKLMLPTYEDYLKDVNNTSKKKETFHQSLKTYYKKNPKAMNDIVKESIEHFLKENQKEKYETEILNQKLTEQKNKLFLLHKEGKFYLDQIKDHMSIERFKEIKNKNTVVFETTSKAEIHCLLRWKNGNGCIGPAWQIKLVLKNVKKAMRKAK